MAGGRSAGRLAALTRASASGTLVTGNTYRYPPILAKQVAQVDIISDGRRVVLGMGAGWQEQNERTCVRRSGLYSARSASAWLASRVDSNHSQPFSNERTNFDGKYYQIKDAPLMPKRCRARPCRS